MPKCSEQNDLSLKWSRIAREIHYTIIFLHVVLPWVMKCERPRKGKGVVRERFCVLMMEGMKSEVFDIIATEGHRII